MVSDSIIPAELPLIYCRRATNADSNHNDRFFYRHVHINDDDIKILERFVCNKLDRDDLVFGSGCTRFRHSPVQCPDAILHAHARPTISEIGREAMSNA